jgi:hypothetical protein
MNVSFVCCVQEILVFTIVTFNGRFWGFIITCLYRIFQLEVKEGKIVPVHAMKAYQRSRGIAALILNLSTRWKIVVDFTLWQLYPRERTLVPIEWEAGWGPERDLDGFCPCEDLNPRLCSYTVYTKSAPLVGH